MSTDSYGGFLFIFDEPARAEAIRKDIERNISFTDTFSDLDWPLESREVFLLSLDERSLPYASLVKRGHLVATGKRSIQFDQFVALNPPIAFSELQPAFHTPINYFFARASSGAGRRLDTINWLELLARVKQLRPSIADDLDRLLAARHLPEPDTDKPGFRTMAEQKDAVNLAMRIAGFDHGLLSKAPLPAEQPAPFLSILGPIALREDKMIEHDAHVPFIDDLRLSYSEQSGRIVFTNGKERLYLMDVNRHPIEEALGVDLLYYSQQYNSFVLVQYKRLSKEGGRWRYRPSDDKNFQNELDRMTRCQLLMQGSGASVQAPQSFRLYPDPFHFKFCRSEVDEPASAEMIPGIYVPLTYLIRFQDSDIARGPRKGVYIGEDNIGRNYSNTLFIELVRNGWVGSYDLSTDGLKKVFHELIATGRSTILAMHDKV